MPKNLGKTPPMGWNTWNTFTDAINEELIMQSADVMVESGLKDCGYQYVVIDDCWSLKERDKNGKLVPDPAKFPHGMKAVADYVHSRGLKFGMYSCNGTHTCAGYPASFEHEFTDAKTFAKWGVDFLKYDNCYKPDTVPGEILYKRMAMALRNCGRDILFSACNWGADGVHNWIRESGAQMYRSTGDIQDTWNSIVNLAKSQFGKQSQQGVYCWNDIDMLVVGMHGGSISSWIGEGGMGCTDTEYKTHFSMWAIMNSPLMIGCDIRNMSDATKNILMNKDVIAVNQDPEGRGAYLLNSNGWAGVNVKILVKALENGDYAICMVNFGDHRGMGTICFWDMGLPAASGYGFELYDCWEHEVIGRYSERYSCDIESHDCKFLRAKLVKM